MFFILLPIAILLAVGMYLGAKRVIEQEQRRFTLDFSTLIGYLNEQELFLHQLQKQNGRLAIIPLLRVTSFHEVSLPVDSKFHLYEGRETEVDLPFTLACQGEVDCARLSSKIFSLGGYLSAFYSSFWATSYFPAATVFFVNENDSFSLGVPAVNTNEDSESISIKLYLSITNAVRQKLQSINPENCQNNGRADKIIWFRTPSLPDQVIGLIPAGFPPTVWKGTSLKPSCLYAATLLNRSQTGVLERKFNPAPKHVFWLQYKGKAWVSHREHGLLIGENEPPKLLNPGLNYTLNGLVLKVTDKTDNWTGVYLLSYSSFFRNNLWLPLGTLLIIIISILGSTLYMRWYNSRVIKPAQQAQRDILESEAFNRTLIQTAPMALCIIARDNGHVVFANPLALELMGATAGEPLPKTKAMTALLKQIKHTVKDGTIDRLDISPERTLYVAYAPTRYMQQDVILCIFADVSSHAQIERNLLKARKAAEEANEAKSTFLATMSHEIRTPLYGALGTLELLSLTQLTHRQRQYVDRIEDASQILLQIISDILDISKIEAGQLQLEQTTFNPRELIQSCTGAYAGMAYRKGLLLFSVIATDIPHKVIGDPTRLRQILSNLISNAIKFTETGFVIVRLNLLNNSSSEAHLSLEVCDSGVGISKERQEKLFTPFYLASTEHHILGGAGLGLSICARLAELMNTKIQLKSESMLGSKFFFELNLVTVTDEEPVEPELNHAKIWVRTPHPELTANICGWLNSWGANTTAVDTIPKISDESSIMLDILHRPHNETVDWNGRYLALFLSGETGTSEIDAYSISSIGFGIDHLIHDKAAIHPPKADIHRFHLRVLVAEDHPLNRITLKEQLEQLGCEVTLAEDGEEALALWDITPYDMVLTDVNMPYMNGYELARKLRSEGASQPIIGVTANAMRDEEQRCVESGMNGWLVKPIELRELVSLLCQYSSYEQDASQSDVPAVEPQEPNILTKHRRLFLQSMWEDWKILESSIAQNNCEDILMILHRMRGALTLAKQREMSSRIELLELQIKSSGLDETCLAWVIAVANEINNLLCRIEAESI
ncbi:response regulator [Kosakonia oryziphila]|uniref:response regulator n=1 Tax=Kosakonia oryziphila TaxID=1005667 RepID=UPI001428BF15|nr:response regulator [Kosakonia oryziphila]